MEEKRKRSDYDHDVSVETVDSAPSIVDNSNDLDDESDDDDEEEDDDDDDNDELKPEFPDIDWEKNCKGTHESLPFTGITLTNFTLEKDKRNGFARTAFFFFTRTNTMGLLHSIPTTRQLH